MKKKRKQRETERGEEEERTINIRVGQSSQIPCSKSLTIQPQVGKGSSQELERYRSIMDGNLNLLPIPVKAVTCKEQECSKRKSDQRVNDGITVCCLASSKATVPGWDDYVKKFKEQSCSGIICGRMIILPRLEKTRLETEICGVRLDTS